MKQRIYFGERKKLPRPHTGRGRSREGAVRGPRGNSGAAQLELRRRAARTPARCRQLRRRRRRTGKPVELGDGAGGARGGSAEQLGADGAGEGGGGRNPRAPSPLSVRLL